MAYIPQIASATGLSNEHTFYPLRVLLGFAEVCFFPGIIFYLTLWFPSAYRARMIGYFMAAIPAPRRLDRRSRLRSCFSTAPADSRAGNGFSSPRRSRPSSSPSSPSSISRTVRRTRRGSGDERDWIIASLAAEEKQRATTVNISVWRSLANPRVLALSLVYFGGVAALYGVSYWLPSIVKGFGVSIAATGWISAIPFVVGFIGMIWYGRHSDANMGRVAYTAVALAPAALGIGVSGLFDEPYLKMIALSFGAFGVFSFLPILWTLPTARLPFRRGRNVRNRCDQFDRQFGGLFRPFRDGMDQGRDRQLHR
jgi:hypothetical protein